MRHEYEKRYQKIFHNLDCNNSMYCDIGGLHQYSDETGRKNICQSFDYKWENEVQIFDADAMENTGMVENIETLAWIAPRGGAGIDTVGIEQIQSQNEYIVESSQYLNQDKEIINTEGFDTWVRVVQEQVMPAKETSETGHGDYLIYKHGDNGYLAIQSGEDRTKWTVWELPGYGEWLDKEVAMFIRMVTGL